ncbi:hypothetical protein GGR56DRAFT_665055 [Xylariaceae sp. FL0804]|nr:hypothetical protein GGR56DRAFT_665055 [Xylariaceae sp. FL0804]
MDMPIRPPPPGREANFTNPESRAYQLVILIAVYTAVVGLLTSLRVYTRLRITRSWGADDFLWKPGGGILGIHLWDVQVSHYIEYSKGSLADSVLIRITNTVIKVAFFVFYLRLFGSVTYIRYMAWIGIAVVVTFGVVFVLIDLISCAPWPSDHGNWLSPDITKRCGLIVDLITAGAYFSVITDFYTLLIPLSRMPYLRVSRRKKTGLTLLFLTGLGAAGAGIANLVIRSDKKVFQQADFTWTIIPVYATAISEINVGLLCHSIPVVAVLFVGRFTSLSKSLGSWIKERRSPRQSHRSDSTTNLAADESGAPRIPNIPSDASFSWLKTMHSKQPGESRETLQK